jgi:hypothetical protein
MEGGHFGLARLAEREAYLPDHHVHNDEFARGFLPTTFAVPAG